jgi:hypothetical protein
MKLEHPDVRSFEPGLLALGEDLPRQGLQFVRLLRANGVDPQLVEPLFERLRAEAAAGHHISTGSNPKWSFPGPLNLGVARVPVEAWRDFTFRTDGPEDDEG